MESATSNFDSLDLYQQEAVILKAQNKSHQYIANHSKGYYKVNSLGVLFSKNGKLAKALVEYKHKLMNPIVPIEHTTTYAMSVQEQIKHLAPKAVTTIGNIIDKIDAKDSDKLTASFDILDRSGHKPIERIQTQSLDGLNRSQLEELLLSIINKPKSVNSMQEISVNNSTSQLNDVNKTRVLTDNGTTQQLDIDKTIGSGSDNQSIKSDTDNSAHGGGEGVSGET